MSCRQNCGISLILYVLSTVFALAIGLIFGVSFPEVFNAVLIPLIVIAVILFFVFNIFLGMLGTFWFRTRKNRSEIALRMALGCSRMNVFGYYVLEGILLLVSAAIPAVFVCANMQMADLTVHTLMEPAWGRFLLCFVSAMLLLGIIILLGIYFPARKAMRIEPADALHNE